MAIRRPDSLIAYGLIGALCPVPFFALGRILWPLLDVSDGIAPLVCILFWAATAWGGSFLSACVCRLLLTRRDEFLPLLLANSAGWVGLLLVIEWREELWEEPLAVTIMVLVISLPGLLIAAGTWRLIDQLRGQPRRHGAPWAATIGLPEDAEERSIEGIDRPARSQ
jgi:hypothetical protein